MPSSGLPTRMLLFLLAVALGAGEALASARSKNEEGNRLYRQKKYVEALKRYTEAQLEAPDSPRLHYNLGNVFYRQGELEKARDEYRRALAAAEPALDPRTVYNLGNSFFTQEQYREAISAYQRALKLDPGDADAKRNLELSLLRLRQQKQQQPRQGGERKQDPNPSPPSPGKKDPSSPESQGKPQGEKGDEKETRGKREGQAPKPKGSLTREEAERILDALQEDEKANMKRRLEATREKQEEVGQDW